MSLRLLPLIPAFLALTVLRAAPTSVALPGASPTFSPAPVIDGVDNAVEKDPTIQAHGTKGWRLERAVITDTNRPRVLLIGDSILNGYHPELVKLLEGKAFVDAWVNPYWQSKTYNALIGKVLDTAGPYDVIHINTGLHGHSGRVKPQEYDPLTREFLDVIARKNPHAVVIWANSTPVTVKKNPAELDPVINADILEQNRKAALIMKERGIPMEDFYGLLVDRRGDLAVGDGFHWKAPAYSILAATASESISERLPVGVKGATNPAPTPASSPAPGNAVLHVSPLGSDSNSGTALDPLRTLARARDLARQSHAREIDLAAGAYPLTETLTLDAADSGVLWKGKGSVITGGLTIPPGSAKPVTDWAILDRLLPEARGKVLEIDLRALGITDYGEVGPRGFAHPYMPAPVELFADGRPMMLSQWPKASEPGIPMGKVIDPGSNPGDRKTPPRGGIFGFSTNRPARWTNADDVWITGFFNNGYADDMLKVASFDLTNSLLTTAQPHCYTFASGKPWNTWKALNLLEEISLPGEYMVERKTGKLYFLPPEGRDPLSLRLEVSVLKDPLVSVAGATNVVFDGIDFSCSRGMGLYIEGGRGNVVRNATLHNLGTVAVCIGRLQPAAGSDPKARFPERFTVNPGTDRNAGILNGVERCRITDTGSGGVLLGGGNRPLLQSAGNFVSNCEIDHVNRWARTYRSAVNIDGVGNVISHCLLHDFPGAIILLHGNNHLIEYNDIHHGVMAGDDMGAFYMGRDPTERGNVLRYNYWHDLGPTHHSYCLYFDDCGGDGAFVFGNVFRKAGLGAGTVFVNGGCDFRIENNIFIDCTNPAHGALRGTPSKANQDWKTRAPGFTGILKNTPLDRSPWKDRYPELLDYLAFKNSTGGTRGLLFSGNLLVNSTINPYKFTVTNNWSTPVDPGFVNAAGGDYALKPDSEVFGKIPGFQPIPFAKIGIEPVSSVP